MNLLKNKKDQILELKSKNNSEAIIATGDWNYIGKVNDRFIISLKSHTFN